LTHAPSLSGPSQQKREQREAREEPNQRKSDAVRRNRTSDGVPNCDGDDGEEKNLNEWGQKKQAKAPERCKEACERSRDQVFAETDGSVAETVWQRASKIRENDVMPAQ
jgi:hypothetical protein